MAWPNIGKGGPTRVISDFGCDEARILIPENFRYVFCIQGCRNKTVEIRGPDRMGSPFVSGMRNHLGTPSAHENS